MILKLENDMYEITQAQNTIRVDGTNIDYCNKRYTMQDIE